MKAMNKGHTQNRTLSQNEERHECKSILFFASDETLLYKLFSNHEKATIFATKLDVY